jgi:hypothetical protein
MPDAGPLGETFFDARVRAIVAASFLNSPSGGCVASEVAVTSADQRRFVPLLCDFFEAAFAVFDFVGMNSWMASTSIVLTVPHAASSFFPAMRSSRSFSFSCLRFPGTLRAPSNKASCAAMLTASFARSTRLPDAL